MKPAQALLREGSAHHLRGEYDRAVVAFSAALRHEPESVRLLTLRGEAHRSLGDFGHALSDYSAALKLEPATPTLYLGRGHVYRLMGDADAARALQRRRAGTRRHLERVLRTDPARTLLPRAVQDRRQAHRFVHYEVVVGACTVGTEGDAQTMPTHRRQPKARTSPRPRAFALKRNEL